MQGNRFTEKNGLLSFDARIREMNLGEFEDVCEKLLMKDIEKTGVQKWQPKGGESFADFHKRAKSFA